MYETQYPTGGYGYDCWIWLDAVGIHNSDISTIITVANRYLHVQEFVQLLVILPIHSYPLVLLLVMKQSIVMITPIMLRILLDTEQVSAALRHPRSFGSPSPPR